MAGLLMICICIRIDYNHENDDIFATRFLRSLNWIGLDWIWLFLWTFILRHGEPSALFGSVCTAYSILIPRQNLMNELTPQFNARNYKIL